MGIVSTFTQSDGVQRSAPVAGLGEQKRKLMLERKLSRQRKGSARRAKTRLALARIGARRADRLMDWREKVTTQLVIDNDLIAVENLKVLNMMRSAKGSLDAPGRSVSAKRGLNRAIAQQGWGTFLRRLEEKAVASGVVLVRVPARNTSLRCHGCGHTEKMNRKSQAIFECQTCGMTDFADLNAARNILAAGLAVSGRGGDVGPVAPSAIPGSPVESSTASAVGAA